MPPAMRNPLRPGRAAHKWKRPPPDQSQGSPQEAGAYEQRRTDDGRAAWMRRRCNKTSSRAPNLRPTGTQPHGCGASSQPPEQCHRVRAALDKSGRQPRDARPHQRPARSTTRSHPALKVGGRTPPTVWWFAARTEAAGSRRRMKSLCGPDGSHMNRNGHRRTSHRAARTMRARMSHVGPTMVEPHGCGVAATRPQAAPPNLTRVDPTTRRRAAPAAGSPLPGEA